MKWRNRAEVLLTIVSIVALTLAARTALGQDAFSSMPGISGGVAIIGAPRQGNWKVEGGSVSIMLPRQQWTNIGPATVGNAIKALSELYTNVSFAANPHVAAKPVGDLVNRAEDPLSDLAALRVASANAFDIIAGLNSIFMLVPNDLTFVSAPTPDNSAMECFNLSGYLQSRMARDHDDKKVHELTTAAVSHLQEAIQQAISSVDPLLKYPRFHFYDEGNVLIVIGSRRSIEVASKIIRALPGGQSLVQPGNPNTANSSEAALRDYRNAVKQMQINELNQRFNATKAAVPVQPISAPLADYPPTNN